MARFLPRPRTLLLLALAAWAIFSAGWLTLRWRAVRILEDSIVTCDWSFPSWANFDPRWSKLLPMTRVHTCYLDQGLTNGAEVGWALRRCGGAVNIDLYGGLAAKPFGRPRHDPAYDLQALAFLQALGRQPRVAVLGISNAHFREEEIDGVLAQFPGLTTVQLNQVPYSGKNLPALPALEVANFTDTHFSDEGLRALLQRCPALRKLHLMKHDLTRATLRQIPQLRAQPLKALWLSMDINKLSLAEIEDVRRGLLQAWPGVQTVFGVEGDLVAPTEGAER